ncbi:MAG: Na+/H+ antiporter, partial [Pyrinomonadaceae bacterium]|nr:Na+/H+ antiporter [Pyrinomonadaceae bacterium]
MENFVATETLIIVLLLIVSLVAIVVRRLRVPYTVALVVVGLLITFQRPIEFSLTPELILSLLVPPLVFEAAFHLDFKDLRQNWLVIALLAIPGVLITTFIVGFIVTFGIGISLTGALVFGALISATDPVAVVALFKTIGAPKRLTTLVESESLFNDGTAIVVFKLMLVVALASVSADGSAEKPFDYLAAVIDFVWVSAGGTAVGIGLGYAAAKVISRLDDYLIETTITTVLAFGSFLVAEQLHLSGVLAVVAAGIVTGNLGLKAMSPTTKIVLVNFWEYLAFIANSLVFLLIGLDVNLRELSANVVPIAVALAAVVLSRGLIVYGLIALANLRGVGVSKVSGAYQHVIFWGGLRGAISLALALSLPVALAERDILRVMTFGVVLFTVLVQGTTMRFLMRIVGLGQTPEVELEYERRHGRLLAAQSALKRVAEMQREGLISVATSEEITENLENKIEDHLESQRELVRAYPMLQHEEREDAELEMLRAQRAALTTLLNNGIISDTVHEELVAEVDAETTSKTSPKSQVQSPKS